MEKTSSASRSRPARQLSTAMSIVASCAIVASVGGCGNSVTGPDEGLTNGSVTGGTEPTASGGTNVPGPGSSGGPGPGVMITPGDPIGSNPGGLSTPVAGGPSNTSAPGVVPSSAPNTGGAGNVIGGGGNTGNPVEACVDVLPPPDPEWPDATCASWAAETEECSADWFANYCDASCGRCVPQGGLGNGGMSSVAEPCEDVLPPPDPEWPDATCATWATETEECAADWFADYCDISCGRCVPEGGPNTPVTPEPVPETCEDVLPPPDPEWPDATCATWATETTECSAAWFADYCDVSCGRCVPEGGLPPEPTGPDCSGEGLPNVSGGEGFATRYWDCCQPHCAQFDGHKCSQDGVSSTGDQNSACSGGGSFACYDEAPRAMSDCLSYGHIAKANPNCGECYRIQFTGQGEHNANDPGSKLIAGKQMIVKVTNTGGDVGGSQFDLMIPGGGVGQFNACSNQWGTSDLGAQYGGFLSECSGSHAEKKECVRQECMKIPAGSARDGCIWFVDWLQVADNPRFTSEPTSCPF